MVGSSDLPPQLFLKQVRILLSPGLTVLFVFCPRLLREWSSTTVHSAYPPRTANATGFLLQAYLLPFFLKLFVFFFNLFIIYLLFYFWLCWVFVSVRGLSLVAASRGHSSSRCAGLSLSRPLLLRSTGSRHAGSVVVAHRPSCSAARGIFPDQGSNPCPLHWQADCQPLHHWEALYCLFTQTCATPFF